MTRAKIIKAKESGSLRGWHWHSLVEFSAESDLSFVERWVWSRAVAKLKDRQIPSVRKLAAECKLRRHTVSQVVGRLVESSLVEWDGVHFKAVRPPDGWIKYVKQHGGSQWFMRLPYVPVLLPAPGSGLDIRDSAIFGFFVRATKQKSQRDVNYTYLSAVLGMDRTTISGRLGRLRERKMIRFVDTPHGPREVQPGLWNDRQFLRADSDDHDHDDDNAAPGRAGGSREAGGP